MDTTLNQPNRRRRVSTDRLQSEDSQLVPSLGDESGPTTAGEALLYKYLCPQTRFRRESEHAKVIKNRYSTTVTIILILRISVQSHELGCFLRTTKSYPTSGEQLPVLRGYTKSDFTVDEEKGRLNPSRDQKLRQAPRKEGGEILCDPAWCVHKFDVQNRNGMTTHIHNTVRVLNLHRDKKP